MGEVSIGPDGPGEVITVVGRLSLASSPAFWRIVQILADRGVRTVVVDLRGADVDASGIRMLATAQCSLQRRGGEIVLKAPRLSALRLLAEARVVDRFRVF